MLLFEHEDDRKAIGRSKTTEIKVKKQPEQLIELSDLGVKSSLQNRKFAYKEVEFLSEAKFMATTL